MRDVPSGLGASRSGRGRVGALLLAALLAVVVGACRDTTESGGDAGATTAVAGDGSAPSTPVTAAEPADATTTGSGDPGMVPSGTTGVVASREGVLGWFDGTTWVQAQTSAPLEGNERFQVFRLGDGPRVADAVGLDRGCPVLEEGVGVRFDPSPWPEFDPFVPHGIAVSAPWDATPRPVEDLAVSEAYQGIASELLEGRGLDEEGLEFPQLVRTDIDGDGVDEVFGVIERRSGDSLNPAPAGDYSIAFARVVRGDDAETLVLAEWVVTEAEEEGTIQDLVVFRFDALADADGDGVDEVALRSSYYEGSAVALLDWQGPESGLVEVISTGCGA